MREIITTMIKLELLVVTSLYSISASPTLSERVSMSLSLH